MDDGPELAPGVRELEHTADLGIVVEADSLTALFDRAAVGTVRLTFGDAGARGPGPTHASATTRDVQLEAANLEELLVRWLRELLFLQEVEGFTYVSAHFHRITDEVVDATVSGVSTAEPRVCDLKGVTYHGLQVGRDGDGWRAQVIFDV